VSPQAVASHLMSNQSAQTPGPRCVVIHNAVQCAVLVLLTCCPVTDLRARVLLPPRRPQSHPCRTLELLPAAASPNISPNPQHLGTPSSGSPTAQLTLLPPRQHIRNAWQMRSLNWRNRSPASKNPEVAITSHWQHSDEGKEDKVSTNFVHATEQGRLASQYHEGEVVPAISTPTVCSWPRH
jgi:hypothetical protein